MLKFEVFILIIFKCYYYRKDMFFKPCQPNI